MSKLSRMREGGQIHGQVRRALYELVDVGVTPQELEQHALRLIREKGAEPSFTKVKDYRWATCINVNASCVHGIPTSQDPFRDGDLVTLDVGVFFRGYHLDGAFTKIVGNGSSEAKRVVEGGLAAIAATLKMVKPGNHIGHLSQATERALAKFGLSPFRELTGHGVGRDLHENPNIPNLLEGKLDNTPQLVVGQTLAIEIIYTLGSPTLLLEEDGWTITTKDGKLSGVFEETVEVTVDGVSVLTQPTLFQIT
jgi:methionyl aminopeptidase